MMMKKGEKATLIEIISIKNIVNLSIVDMVMLQLLLKHEKPVVRHMLYNEISQFLTREKKKVAKSIKFNDGSPGAKEFKELIDNDKKFSTSSFYNSLKNLEGDGLVKSNKDENDKIISVEATKFTEILINTISKHIIRFGLIEAEKSKLFPDIIKEVIEEELFKPQEINEFGTALYISLSDFINAKCIKNLRQITDNLFILSKKEEFDNISKLNYKNIQTTSVFNKTIREPDNFFDMVVVPYYFGITDLEGVTKEDILKEAFRIIKESGNVIIHGYNEMPKIDHALLNTFIKWVENVYTDIETSSEKKFKEALFNAGAKEAKVFVYRGHLFGIGNK